MWRLPAALVVCAAIALCADPGLQRVVISKNQRFLQTADGRPFFWLGDTAWLLSQKLDRDEAERYFEDRRAKGFNVVQCSILHSVRSTNAYGMAALVDADPARPNVTPGSDPEKQGEYDYWDHVDWLVDTAASKGIYLAIVASWGSNMRSGRINAGNVRTYAQFLAERYKDRVNIFWVAGGDTHGNRQTDVWRAMSETFKEFDPNHLVTFHPFGRTQSSTWFHNEPWLDFNMFQSGHRRYDQDNESGKGEDNWRYVEEDLGKQPPKPTIDGEPSYEGIPQGLHDPKEPLWTGSDARRYAYWSVFAGAFGHTYGHSAIMQMFRPSQPRGAYGNRKPWFEALNDSGASHMQHLKKLMLSKPFFERVPDQSLIAGENSEKYDRLIATLGKSYAFLYTYTGKPFEVRMGVIAGRKVRASWYDPRNGGARAVGTFSNKGTRRFTPPGEPAPGNDWVLVLEDAAARART
jgi:hypothetical protein